MRKQITLACSLCGNRNYTTKKSSTNTAERLEVKKFCKTCNSHTSHLETK
ncbi:MULTISPECIES: 50S ribosomal protein L33 [Bacillus]|nr:MULTISPECIES: 50S ribosomal protein L33 [Bacillus]MED1095615.1 50S ribosomal protein L33 [Bacillus capparidis]